MRRSALIKRQLVGFAFVAPFLTVFVALFVVPLGYSAYLSLYRSRLVGGTTFVGLDNYRDAFADPRLREGVARVAAFFVIQVPLMLVIATLMAFAIDSGRLRFARLIRLGIFVPYAVPSVVAAMMWGYLYGPDFGPIAQFGDAIGIEMPNLLGARWILGSLANIVFWEFTGYNMIIVFAALRGVSTELYEAAAVDGAGQLRVAWSIKLPAIRPALALALLFSVIGSFQLFNEPNLLRIAAPVTIDTSFTPNLYAYSLAFTGRQVNYAASVSFLLGAVIFVLSGVGVGAYAWRRSRVVRR